MFYKYIYKLSLCPCILTIVEEKIILQEMLLSSWKAQDTRIKMNALFMVHFEWHDI
jgi:hypothetical protein